ncbi:MAG: hypothetical protein V5789_01470 [Colwellia sp.]
MRKSSLKGELINTVFLPANELWDTSHLVIKVPVRLGLLSYRLLLVNKADMAKFAKITTLADLKKLTAGVASGWETTKVFKKQGIKLVETGYFEGIFSMLNGHRFDYLPRGIYEIYAELDARQHLLNDVVVEPTLALNIPMFTYVYVSPKYPRLANRLGDGLRELLVTGELKKILYKHYAEDIKRANLKERKIITIENNHYNQHASDYHDDLLFTQ